VQICGTRLVQFLQKSTRFLTGEALSESADPHEEHNDSRVAHSKAEVLLNTEQAVVQIDPRLVTTAEPSLSTGTGSTPGARGLGLDPLCEGQSPVFLWSSKERTDAF
jgi:hypothetical protein